MRRLIFIFIVSLLVTGIREVNAQIGYSCFLPLLLRDQASPTPPLEPDTVYRIAMVLTEGGDEASNIITVRTDGSDRHILGDATTRDSWPAWSPDGDWIAVYRYAPPADKGIWVLKRDFSERRRLTATGFGAAWSPDGRRIAFTAVHDSKFRIHVMDSDGSNQALLNPVLQESIDYEYGPSWSPDGRTIAYVVNGWSSEAERESKLCLHTLQTAQNTCIASGFGYAGSGPTAWSPDGQWLLFGASWGSGPSDSRWRIFRVRADGTELASITSGAAEQYHPSWSPDGAWIAYSQYDGQTRQVYIANPDGSGSRCLLCELGQAESLSWCP